MRRGEEGHITGCDCWRCQMFRNEGLPPRMGTPMTEAEKIEYRKWVRRAYKLDALASYEKQIEAHE